MIKYDSYKPSGIEWLGDIPSHWEVYTLRYLCDFIVPMRDKPKNLNGNIPWIRIEDFKGKYIDTSKSGQGVFEREINELNLKVFPENTVLCSCSCAMGKTAIVKKPLISNQTFIGLLPKKNLISDFLYYFNFFIADYLDSIATGTIQGYLSKQEFKDLKIAIPNKIEQLKITNFLDKKLEQVDNYISKQKELIELLKEKKNSLINQAVTKGLDPKVEYKESGIEWLGKIPKHWEVIKIKRLCLVKRGASPRPIDDPRFFDENGEYSWVRIADVSKSDKYLYKTTQKMSKLGSSKSVKLEPNKIFLSIAGSVGKPMISKIKCCIHDGFVWFDRLRKDIDINFLYYIFLNGEAYKGLGKLGTQLNLNTDTVGMISIPMISLNEQKQIVEYIEKESSKIDKVINTKEDEIKLLDEYKQSLISSAVTGKIKVS